MWFFDRAVSRHSSSPCRNSRQPRKRAERARLRFEPLERRRLPSINMADVTKTANHYFDGDQPGSKHGPLADVGWDLTLLYAEYQAYEASGAKTPFQPTNQFLVTSGDSVLVEATVKDSEAAADAALKGLGMKVTAEGQYLIDGYLPIDEIAALAALPSIAFSNESYRPIQMAGSVTSEGDATIQANSARKYLGLDGSGVTVGVLSDSYNHLGGASADIASGDLPAAGVNVIQDDNSSTDTDEGRAMLQIVHDVAPGASLDFATALGGQQQMANNITALKNAGAKVIVDDFGYAAEPMFQDGPIAQAVESAVNAGVVYVSAAGNQGTNSLQSSWRAGPVLAQGAIPGGPTFYGGTTFDFDPGPNVNDLQSVTLQPHATMTVSLQWDSPFKSLGGSGSQNDLDIYLLNGGGSQVLAESALDNINGDPFEVLQYTNNSDSDESDNLMITKYSGADPGLIKYVLFQNFQNAVTINDFTTNSPTLYGHANASNDIAVAAEYWNSSPPTVESFSSVGPTQILFDTSGNRITPITRNHPDVTGPDGVSTTMAGFTPFYGTSAAAPHVAGTAALMLQSVPSASPGAVASALEQTATDMGPSGYDYSSGYGLIQAPAAVLALGGSNTVTLDGSGDSSGDAFKIVRSGGNDQFYVNSALVFTGALSGIGKIVVKGSSYDDSLTVDSSGGDAIPSGGISYDGAGGNNSLSIIADANITQTSGGWSLTGGVTGTISVTNVYGQTTLTGGPSANSFTVSSGTATVNLGAGDQATLNDGSIGPGYANTATAYADRTDFSGSTFAYHVIGVGNVTVNGTGYDKATVYDGASGGGQGGPDVLDADTGSTTATMRYWNGGTLSIVYFGNTTAVQQNGPDFATQAAASASSVTLQGTWHVNAAISPPALQSTIAGTEIAQAGNLNEQDLFQVGADGLMREDRYYYNTHTDSGLSVIDSSTTFAQGTKITAYSDGSSLNVFAVAQDGRVKWAQYTSAGGWTTFVSLDQFITGANVTFAAGAPLTGAAEPGSLYIFGVATDGALKEYQYTSSTASWSLSNHPVPSFPSATPMAIWDRGSGAIDLFGVYADGSLEVMQDNNGAWHWNNVTALALTGATPLAVSEWSGTVYLFGVTSAGGVDEIHSTDFSSWFWHTFSAASDKYANNSALGVRQYSSGQFKLYGVDVNNEILNFYSTGPDTWGNQALGGAPPFSAAAGVALYSDSSGLDQVFTPTTTNDLAVLEYSTNNNLWSEHPLGRPLSPSALQNSISGTVVAQTGNLNEQDLFEVGSDGLVREDKYYYSNHTDSGLSIIDSGTTFASGTKLTAYTDGSTVNVFGVANDGDLKWAQYNPGRGWSTFVSLDDFIPGASVTFAPGAPLSGAAESGTLYIFGVATDGSLKEYRYDTSTQGWSLSNHPAPSFPSATPMSIWDRGAGLIDLFGVYADGSLEAMQDNNGSWHWNNISALALNGPTPLAVSEWAGTVYLFGVTSNGSVDEIHSSDFSSWFWNIISSSSDRYANNSALGVRQYSSGQFKLYGVDVNDQILNFYSTGPGTWGNQALGGAPPFSAAAGVALYPDPSGVDEVFGMDTSGDLAVLEYNTNNNFWAEHRLA